MTKLRVLVIDDSAFNRQTIAEILASHPEIEVIGKAFDGEEGLKLAAQLQPDLITLDIEMPRMDGFTFLRILMSRTPTPVIVISSHSRKEEVFQALELGALDFVAKPSHHIGPELTAVRDELISKTLMVRSLQAMPFAQGRKQRGEIQSKDGLPVAAPAEAPSRAERIVCMGASTGGPPGLESLFKALPADKRTAFVVAQHMPAKFTRAFADRLNRMSRLTIQEANDGALVLAGHAYVAPGGKHLRVEAQPAGGSLLCVQAAQEADRYVPSIDLLFRSVAASFKEAALAVILTGMGSDGRLGVEAVRGAGGRTVAESDETAIVFGMPKEAIETGCVDEILALPQLVDRVHAFLGEP